MAAVTLFYERVRRDPSLAHFFEGLDMDALATKQVAFMAHALDGPTQYRGRPLREAHERLIREQGLTPTHFDGIVEHLSGTLQELGISAELVSEVARRVSGTRAQIFGQ